MRREDMVGFAFVFMIFISGFIISLVIGSVSCGNKAVSFENYEYKIFGGCMVEHKGKWIPLNNIRGIDV